MIKSYMFLFEIPIFFFFFFFFFFIFYKIIFFFFCLISFFFFFFFFFSGRLDKRIVNVLFAPREDQCEMLIYFFLFL